MKRKVLTTATAVLFAASAAAFAADANSGAVTNQGTTGVKQGQSLAEQPTKTGQKGEQNARAQQQPTAPEGFVLVEEDTVYMMAREPQQHMLRAHEQMDANPKAAAEEVRLAAAYLKMEAARPGEENKEMLAHWEHRLSGLAQKIQNGEVKTPEFTREAAGANYALARYFDERAQRELGNENHQVAAGYDLRAAADAFEQSLIWSSNAGTQNPVQKGAEVQTKAQAQQLPQEEIKAITDARSAGDELIAADNLANSQGENAQPAASKIGPNGAAAANNNASKNEATANAAAIPDAKKASSELSKAIQDRGDRFKTQQEGNEKDQKENGQKASANQK